MKEDFGNLWSYLPEADARVITTNGFIKTNGDAVMGRGCAAEAARRFPLLPRILGKKLAQGGNHVHVIQKSIIQDLDYDLITFPVKHHWHENADLDLIFRSACELADEADHYGYGSVICPRFGAGNGNLPWEEVRATVENVLDHRFYIITYPEDE